MRSLTLQPGHSLPSFRWFRRWAPELWFPAALPSKLRGVWLLPRWDCLPLNTSAFLDAHFAYYHRARTHLALEKDAPDVRPIERVEAGTVRQIPEVGGLHHRCVRRAV